MAWPFVIAGVGAGISALGQYASGKAQKKIAYANAAAIEKGTETNAGLIEEGTQANAAILDWNAAASEAQATDAVQRGRQTEGLFRKQVRGQIGATRTGYAGQGVEVNRDTSLGVQADMAYLGELDALTIRTNAAREAWGYKLEAQNTRMQAAATRKAGTLEARAARQAGQAEAASARMGGNIALSAGKFGAAGTIVGTTSNLLMQRYGFQKAKG